ncbi:MAG TPA: hypothetical protein VMS43_03720 [Allosphingosinicella sp.]|nr:hypothetical protein [Allosphingosinicella sp.]
MIRILRLLLLAALMLAPAGRIGMAEAAAAPAAASGHCADMPRHEPARAPASDERMAVDCMIACAALGALPAPFVAPASVAANPPPIAASFPDPTGISPEAEPRPPRSS